MRPCDACCREFTGRNADCPWCGFNNSPRGAPRSAKSLAAKEREKFERELSQLSDEFATWLGWVEAPDHFMSKDIEI